MIKKKLSSFKSLLKIYKLDGYIIPKNDCYFTEQVKHDRLRLITNFSGSAGIAIVTSIVSILTGIPINCKVAMTGEITLRGRVLPIGGLKEKLLAALRSGITKVIIPKENEKDLEDIPSNVKKSLKIVPAENIMEVLKEALTKKITPIDWKEEDIVSKSPVKTNDENLITH